MSATYIMVQTVCRKSRLDPFLSSAESDISPLPMARANAISGFPRFPTLNPCSSCIRRFLICSPQRCFPNIETAILQFIFST